MSTWGWRQCTIRSPLWSCVKLSRACYEVFSCYGGMRGEIGEGICYAHKSQTEWTQRKRSPHHSAEMYGMHNVFKNCYISIEMLASFQTVILLLVPVVCGNFLLQKHLILDGKAVCFGHGTATEKETAKCTILICTAAVCASNGTRVAQVHKTTSKSQENKKNQYGIQTPVCTSGS